MMQGSDATRGAVSIDDLSSWMEVALAARFCVAPLAPTDHKDLIALEGQLFPDSGYVFNASGVRSVTRAFPHSIMVAKGNSDRIESYVSIVPLDRINLEYCLRTNVRSICCFPESRLCSNGSIVSSFFFEVLASRPECPFEVKWDVMSVAVAFLNKFAALPFLSCPVTDQGLRILSKLQFKPMQSPGLGQLYIRGTSTALEDATFYD